MPTYRSKLRSQPVYQRALRNHQRRLGDRLRGLREQLGLTQAQAAEQIGLSRNQVVRIEAGLSNVTLATVVAAALAYGVEVWELFERSEPVRSVNAADKLGGSPPKGRK